MRSRIPPRPLLSCALYAQQMIQQDGYLQEGHDACGSALDERIGLRVGAEGMLWGSTNGSVQGEWDRMYAGLRYRVSHKG
jgi:hypothetical protein